MDFVLAKESEKYKAGFLELLQERGYACRSGIEVQMQEENTEEITVIYENKKAVIRASETNFLYRGLMTLVMHLENNGTEEPCFNREKVWFDHNGCMVDCSRNCVMSVEAVKAWMRMQACVGMNQMMLYTEDTYEVPEYPYFGAYRGRYTSGELMEMDSYAQMLGIELIPCIQTLGHLQQPLRWQPMKGMRDTSDILMVGDEKVYEFIRACIKQTAKCFKTRRVHLGMDEAWTLGLGQYLIKNGYTPKQEIIQQHMSRVMEICREEGLEPMIWSDMYLRILSKTEDYYNVETDTDMRKGADLPEGMTLVYWDYFHMDEESYRNYLHLHKQLTDKIMFAGGGWTWSGTVPSLPSAWAVTYPAYRACKKEGIREVIYTLWGDDGTETPQFAGLGPVLLAAEFGFGEEPDEKRIKEKFEFLTGCRYETYLELGKLDLPSGKMSDHPKSANPSKCLLFQDVLLGMYDGQTEGVRYGSFYKGIEEKLNDTFVLQRPSAEFWHLEMKQILEFYGQYAKALTRKADMGLEILELYEKKDKEGLKKVAEEMIPETIAEIEKCRRMRMNLWNREGKIFGWEILDIRYRSLCGRMESAAERLNAYISGTITSLPELEEERLRVFPESTGEDRMNGGNISWINLISASPLAWGWLPQ